MNISGGDFTGNSVAIIGTRVDSSNNPLPADSKYRCTNGFNSCFNLSGSNPTVSVNGLCPSADIQKGFWTFQYNLYSSGCDGGVPTGTLLNGGGNPNNFICYDSHDLFTQLKPNQTYVENIAIGANSNDIACLTVNAEKSFSFSSCAVLSQTSSQLSLDCGCTYTSGTCNCGSLAPGNLQNNAGGTCVIDSTATPQCSVVCCSAGLNDCSGTCANLNNDLSNCGACVHVCPAKTDGGASICVNGTCG